MQPAMSVLGIDIAKRVFHAVGMDERGKIVLRKRLSRHDLMPFATKLPRVLIGLEACGGAHYWARRFRHEVKLMAPQFVKPYVKSNKNDSRDAEAIAEAVICTPSLRILFRDLSKPPVSSDTGGHDLQIGFQPLLCPGSPVSERNEPLHTPMLNLYPASLNFSLFVGRQSSTEKPCMLSPLSSQSLKIQRPC